MKLTIFCVVGLLVFLVSIGTTKSQDSSEYDYGNGEEEDKSEHEQDKSEHKHEHENHHGNRGGTKVWNVAAKLYKKAVKPEHENLIFSPLSLTTSMAMLSSGAGGETAREIQNLFKFGNNSEFTIQNQTEIINSLTNPNLEKVSGVKFVTASRIYANIKNSNLRQNYVRAVSSLGEVETLDFSEPRTVVDNINNWVKTQTQGKISNIVKVKDFNVETAAVLLNTLYFKAPWKQPFNKSNTEKDQDFHVSEDKKPVKVDMMFISAEFPYVDLDEAQASAVFLPYKGDRFSMVIYLPWKGRKLSVLEGKLETLVPAEIRNEAETSQISLFLPKFNISSSLDFKEILTSLGVGKMFNREEADFSEMSESPEFHVSKVRQNIFMQVNEEGTEAAAVTDVETLAPVSAPNVVKVNRPFIFQIYDSVTGTVLLSGRVVNPNERMEEPIVVTEFERKIWNVTTKVYKKVNKTEHENLIFSPLSLTTSMVMLSSGAGGETAREIQNLFKFGNNSEFTIQNQTGIINSLKNETLEKQPDVQFVIASRIYANSQKAQLRENYVRAVSSLGDVETLDFTKPKPVVTQMNEWVKSQTQGKISNIVGKGDFNVETAAVLLNTLYFKAPWKQQFKKSDTKTADFHVSENNKTQVQMMYIDEEFPYVDLDAAQASAVFLPYKGDRFSMIIYLPWKERKVSVLEGKLETLVPAEVRNEAEKSRISLYLPKFNISSSLDFEEVLTSLGVQKIFKGEDADFSGMSEAPQFHVSKVRQDVFVEVNEEGDEPQDDDDGLANLPAPNVLTVDRPFIFQIYDSVTGAVLISGRVSNPNEQIIERPDPKDEPEPDGTSTWTIFIAVFSTLVVLVVGVAIAYFVRARGYFNRTLVPSSDAINNKL